MLANRCGEIVLDHFIEVLMLDSVGKLQHWHWKQVDQESPVRVSLSLIFHFKSLIVRCIPYLLLHTVVINQQNSPWFSKLNNSLIFQERCTTEYENKCTTEYVSECQDGYANGKNIRLLLL